MHQIHDCFKSINIKVLVSNSFNIGFEQIDYSSQYSVIDNFQTPFNNIIEKILINDNIYFFDIKSLIFAIGANNCYNYNLGFLYQMPYTKDFINYYRGYLECVEKKNLLIFEKEFYEKMYEVQKRDGIGGV